MAKKVHLKDEWNIDVEQINQLPFEEYMEVMGDLTMPQVKEYLSNLQLKEPFEPMQAVKVNYDRHDQRSGVDASELIDKMRKVVNPNS